MPPSFKSPLLRWLSLLTILAAVVLAAISPPLLPSGEVNIVEPATADNAGTTQTPSSSILKLDVEALTKRSLPELSPSLFGNAVTAPPVSLVVMQPPPQPSKPSAPQLPYTYLGQFRDADGRLLFYLRRDNEVIVAKPGTKLDESYQLESDVQHGLTFTYLPLKEAQVIPIGNLSP
jgi:hypothetical protein